MKSFTVAVIAFASAANAINPGIGKNVLLIGDSWLRASGGSGQTNYVHN